jgi:hypothetical protein
MKNALILAGAALAFVAAPAAAKPAHAGGHGKVKDRVERVDRDYRDYRDARDYRDGRGYYAARDGRSCPPGLAKKNNGCLPPGQAKKLRMGQRYVSSYGYNQYSYNSIPYDLRRQYDLDPYNQYYYDQGNLYGVDPRTMIVEQVIRAILR